ncbi:MAG: hypothetical protein AUK54_03715 [Helicobacteraceae bacterium CG2_30_36_10]|nr:MAG: hypothetical protein AUK54_03715 [Helicobacteraceae bacterium CG2_30_36_10]
MQLKLEFVIYNHSLERFEIDENEYLFELDNEQMQTYKLFKDSDLHLYNWLKESDFFLNWIKEEVYPESIGKKIAIRSVNDVDYTRFYFFKVTSGDIHYEYFKKLFDIYHELEWQDREEIGANILEQLMVKRQELIIELKENVVEEANLQEK